MRIETTARTLYKFEELCDTAKERAIAENRDADTAYEWWDFLYDDFKACAAILGIDVEDIQFSGFYSQGDGASFTGRYEYRKGWRKALNEHAPKDTELFEIGHALQDAQRRAFYSIDAQITHRGHYYHSGCMVVDADADCAFDYETVRDQLRLLADWMYSRLEEEYEYLTGDEAVRETLVANEYEFLEDGSRP